MVINSHKKEKTAANDPCILGLGLLNGHSVTLWSVLLTLGHSSFSPYDSSGCSIDGKGRKNTCSDI